MSPPITPETIFAVGLLATSAALALLRRNIAPFAVAWAAFLPIEVVNGVDGGALDAIRYGGAAVLVLLVRPESDHPAERHILRVAGAVALLGVIRVAVALLHHDTASLKNGLVLAGGAAGATLLVRRRSLAAPVTTGYLIGLAVSAVVSIMQASGLSTLAEGNTEGSRYPGLASYTTGFSWQISVGLILALYLAATGERIKPPSFWFGLTLIPLFSLALLTNGAQGGLLGLGAAFLAVVIRNRDQIRRAQARRYAWAAGAMIAVGAVLIVGAGVEIPSVTDYANSNFSNETARIETLREGFQELLDHPLTGTSPEDYAQRHNEIPHFLALEAAAFSGIGGFLVAIALIGYVGWLMVRRPDGTGPEAILGHALLVSTFMRFLTDPQGPVLGLTRMLILLAAIGLLDWRPAETTTTSGGEVGDRPGTAHHRNRILASPDRGPARAGPSPGPGCFAPRLSSLA